MHDERLVVLEGYLAFGAGDGQVRVLVIVLEEAVRGHEFLVTFGALECV